MSDRRTVTHRFQRFLQQAELAEEDWRKDNETNFSYYDGEQWTSDEKFLLEQRGQQATVLNLIRPTIDTVLAMEVERRADIQVVGRNVDDDMMGDMLTELIKHINDQSNSDYYTSQAFREGLTGGRGWLLIDTKKDEKEQEQIYQKWIPWEDVYIDPYHREPDGTDARFIIRKVWQDRDVVKKKWPEKAESIDSRFNDSYHGVEYEAQMEASDRGLNNYYDPLTQRVCICYCWYKNADGDVRYVVFADDIILYGNEKDDSKNNPPKEINAYPLIPFYAFRTHKGKPRGLVKFLRDAQDQLNKLNSKFLWNMSANRIWMEDGAIDGDDLELVRTEMNRPDGVIPLGSGGLGKIKTEDNLRECSVLAGQLQFIIAMMQRTSGVNDSMTGLGGVNERSATQQQNRILQGASMQTQILENLHFSKLQATRVMLKFIGKYYTDHRVVRIREPNGDSRYYEFNKEATDPDSGISLMLNKIDDIMRYDIVLKKVPPFSTVRERTLQIFSEVAKSGILPPQFVGKVMMMLSDLPKKDELIKELETIINAQGQAQPPGA